MRKAAVNALGKAGKSVHVTVIANVFGTRIDCDKCGEHTASPDLSTEQLRLATGYRRPEGQDFDLCPRCAEQLLDRAPR